jgi:outer membrane protein TolC
MNIFRLIIKIVPVAFLLSACQQPNFSQLSQKSLQFLKAPVVQAKKIISSNIDDGEVNGSSASLGELISAPKSSADLGKGFKRAMRTALETDPYVLSKVGEYKASVSKVNASRGQKDFQLSAAIYGGIEDLTDRENGVAVVLTANRMIFDGGLLNAKIDGDQAMANSKKYELEASIDEKAFELASIWVDLERYKMLNEVVETRLRVLDPLIVQLEKVAEAGIGDVTKVAAAQRTVSTIRVAQADVSEKLERARLDFENAFGGLPTSDVFDSAFVSDLVPDTITDKMIQSAPALLAQYESYLAAEAGLISIRAKEGANVGFEARATTPFADSTFDSDESIGLVMRKTLYDGKIVASEIKQAEASVDQAISRLHSTYRNGERIVNRSAQTIKSMDSAIKLAKRNADITSDEISYLRKQLVIGGSTLDSVLSAEARLYEADSQEINFLADRRKAELSILSSLGMIGSALGLKAEELTF